MKKIILTMTIAIAIITTSNGQITVNAASTNETVTINSNVAAWGSGIKVKVPNSQSCAYHLEYGGEDKFYVCALGWLWAKNGGYFGSDSALKLNVTKIKTPLAQIQQLNGIEFDYAEKDAQGKKYVVNDTAQHGKRIGVMAQDVEKVFPGLVRTMPNGVKAVAYTDLIGVLVEGMKEQQVQIEALNSEIVKLKSTKPNNPKSREEFVENTLVSSLEQNAPNPFSEKTEIKFSIDPRATNAKILVFDMNGLLIRSYENLNVKETSLVLNANEYNAGMYLYTLIVDGNEVATKRMILTK
jgi:hypothetical protein